MKFKEQDVYWRSESGNVAVVYNKDSMGNKWGIYQRVLYEQYENPKDFRPAWEYVTSFDGEFDAIRYAKRIYDGAIYR